MRAVVSDSAGVQLVDNAAPSHATLGWRVDTVPVMDIGGGDDPHEEFAGQTMVVRLEDGRILAAGSDIPELRLFDSTGAWLSTIGRAGQGPGEFQSIGWLHAGPGDTIRTYDYGNQRLSVFAPSGEFLAARKLASPGPDRAPSPVAGLDGGRLIVVGGRFVTPATPSGIVRDTSRLLIYGDSGTVVDSFGPFPGRESLVETSAQRASVTWRPFGKTLSLGVAPGYDRVYVGTQDRHEVELWSDEGRLLRRIRWRGEFRPATEADRDALIRSMWASARTGEEEFFKHFEAMLRKAPLPQYKPAYAGLLVDQTGALWVQAFRDPGSTAAGSAEVFDSTGQWLGTVDLPPRFDLRQAGRDFVLGTWKDDDDVEHVRVHRVKRSGRST